MEEKIDTLIDFILILSISLFLVISCSYIILQFYTWIFLLYTNHIYEYMCICVCPGALLGAANAGEACSKTRDKETLFNRGATSINNSLVDLQKSNQWQENERAITS